MYFRQQSVVRTRGTQLKEGLLRVGGRLVNAPLGDERKHPVILPYKHHVTDLIIKQCHENLGHMGQESVLSSLRETVWIVKGRSARVGVNYSSSGTCSPWCVKTLTCSKEFSTKAVRRW